MMNVVNNNNPGSLYLFSIITYQQHLCELAGFKVYRFLFLPWGKTWY